MYKIAPIFQKTFLDYQMPHSFLDILAYNLVVGFHCYISLNERYLFGYFGEKETSFDDANAFRFEDFKEKYKNSYPNLYDYLEQNKVTIEICYKRPYFQILLTEENEKRMETSFSISKITEIFEKLELWQKKEKRKEKFLVLRRKNERKII